MAGFQLKDFVSIAAAMINHARASQENITDFEVGSAVRTIMEAPAVEIEEAYQRFFAGARDAINTSVYKAFEFEAVPAAAAAGSVYIAFPGPIVDAFEIPAGTVFTAPSSGLKYLSTEAVLVKVGVTTATVIVACSKPGIVGNSPAGAITSIAYSLPIGSIITNPAITSGSDGQTDAERRARFVEFIQSLSRGTKTSILSAVRQAKIVNSAGVLTEYVTRVGLDEAPGHVRVYLYSSSGVPSIPLMTSAKTIVEGTANSPGYRAAGVQVDVLPMAERLVPVSLKISLFNGITPSVHLKNTLATLLANVFEAVESGSVLYVEQITNVALTVTGVESVLADNVANELCAPYEVLRLGAFTVEWI